MDDEPAATPRPDAIATLPRPPARPASHFGELFAAAPRETRSRQDLERLVAAYQVAVEGEEAAPAAAPWLAIEAELRPAIAEQLGSEWLAAFEYLAASRARLDGDGAALEHAVASLRAFAERHPDVTAYDMERTVLLADLQRALGDSGAAIAALDSLARRSGPPDASTAAVHAAAWGVRADVLRETGRCDEAADAIEHSVRDALASADAEAIETALLRDQALALAMRQWDACRARLSGYLAAATDDSLRALLLVMRGHAESGMAGDDVDALQRARATLEQARPACRGHLLLRTDLKLVDLALRTGDVDGAGRELERCEATLGAALAADRPSRDACECIAYGTVWRLRRGAPADELVARRPLQAAAVAALIDEWSRQPPTRGGIGFLENWQRLRIVAAALDLELETARRQQRDDGASRALQVLLDLQACTSLARARGAPPRTAADVLTALGDRAALVVLPTPYSTFLLLAQGGRVRAWTLRGSSPVGAELDEYSRWLMVAPAATGEARSLANAALARLGPAVVERLLPPDLLAAIAGAPALTVVGADALGGLPFEALPLPDGRLLGEAVAIDNTASLPFVLHASGVAKGSTARVLLVADTAPDVPGARIAPVAFPSDLVLPALGAYDRADQLVGTRATAVAFRAQELRDYDVVHLVVHQVEREGAPGLLLHDAALWRGDLVDRPCRGLVVLSTCRGAGGAQRVGEGDGFASLAGAFLWNGATAVIASRHELLLLDHLRTMALCHRELAAGASPARAMQLARRVMADGSDLVARVHRAMVQVAGAGQVPVTR